MAHFFFDDPMAILRTLVIGFLAYVCLIVLLRVSGKRTLSKMNAFDFVVTVALGSTLATVLLSKEVTLAQGVTAFALLVGLQFVLTWLSVRIKWVRKVVAGEPVMLVYQGKMLGTALKRARVRRDEVDAALRAQGVSSLLQVEAVVLETDGSFSVLRTSENLAGKSTLDDLTGVPSAGDSTSGSAW